MDRRMMSDEELEALLRRQPRRLPSPALWARFSAQAPHHTRYFSAVWAAAAVAVVGVVLVVAMSRTAPPTPGPTRASVGARRAVSPHDPGRAVARGAGRRSAGADFQPAPARAERGRQALAAPSGPRQVGNLPHGTTRSLTRREGSVSPLASSSPPAPPASGPATPAPPEQPETTDNAAAPPTTVAAANDTNSTYYLEVWRGGTASVLSGSVTRDESGSVTEIEMAYDTANRDAPVKN